MPRQEKGTTFIETESLAIDGSDRNMCEHIFDSISFLPLEETHNSHFSAISKLCIYNEKIFIFDKLGRNALFEFDKKGHFVSCIGEKGKSSNEYTRMWDFDVDSTFIYFYDNSLKKMFYYNHEHKLVKTIRTEYWGDAFKAINNNQFYFSLAKEGDKDKQKMCVVDSELKIEQCLAYYSPDEIDDKISDNHFHEFGNEILFNRPISDTLYILSKSGNLNRRLYVDFLEKKAPLNLQRSYENLIRHGGEEKYLFLFDCPLISNRFLIGSAFHQGKKATILYDFEKKCSCINDWTKGMKMSDLFLPVFACPQYVVGWMDYEVYNAIGDKEQLSTNLVEHLKNGGVVLVFYHFKKHLVI